MSAVDAWTPTEGVTPCPPADQVCPRCRADGQAAVAWWEPAGYWRCDRCGTCWDRGELGQMIRRG